MAEQDWTEARQALGLPVQQDLELLKQAFCHGSYVREHDLAPLSSNQRLEFLGDAVLDLILASQLYADNPGLTEGELTKLKAALVRSEALYTVAKQLELGQYLLLGHGEAEDGGQEKASILADCLESLIAAIYLSCGWEAASTFIMRSFAPLLEEVKSGKLPFDHKTRLQELVQAHGGRPPEYRTVETLGRPHQRTFAVEVSFDGCPIGIGRGPSKQEAEQDAAGEALAHQDDWLPETDGA